MNIILLAPPAAGKGTQAKLLSDYYQLPHISTGDMLRDATRRNDELGSKIKELMAKGEFVSDELIGKIVENRLSSLDCQKGYILDGFPRNMKQVILYKKILEKLNLDLGYVLYLDVDEHTLEERITGRMVCKNCEAIYNINNPILTPIEEGICDKCHGELFRRSDDTREAFQMRYQIYLELTKPIIDYYNELGVLYKIDFGSKEATFNQIKLILDREMN